MILYVATSNAGKLRDFAAAAEVFQVAIEALPGLDELAAPVEDGVTFDHNARLKAAFYSAARPGLMVLADDSGLEVDALGGRPGVRSARFAEDFAFAGEGSLDARNNACLLAELDSVDGRSARYRCVLALARDGVVIETADGTVEGQILTQAAGMGGFGYDPLFLLPELALTMAEISPIERQRLSHRGQALEALLQDMKKIAQTYR